MSLFNDREDAFEKQFAHDEELRFKATARRDKLLGLLIAERLGKTGPDAQDYARSIVLADLQEAGDGDILRKIRQDLEGAGKPIHEAELRDMLARLMAQAIREIQAGQ
jgi:hypothetical protein